MKKMLIGLLLTIVLLAGCSGSGYVDSKQKETTSYTPLIEGELYYVPHEFGKKDFPQKYKIFINENPNLEVFDIEADPNDDNYNSVNGYFIFTKLK